MFCKKKADRAVKFIERLKHTKGIYKGQPFKLLPFQKKIIRDIFGNVDENGNRIIRTVYIELPRKNGKSAIAAAIALYLLFADKEGGAEIYGAACDTYQAAIVFEVAIDMILQSPELSKRCKILESTKRIILNKDRSFYRVLSADHKSKHGFNAHGIIFDELHAQPNRHLWDVLTTSGGTRIQPLTIAITTAGFDKNSICYEKHRYAKQILEGVVEDPSFYPVIYSIKEGDDWQNEKTWKKANPALGKFRSIDEMRTKFKEAQHIPSVQNTFRRLYLNEWTTQSERFIDFNKWLDCAQGINWDYFDRFECCAGLDLASVGDIAAMVLVFKEEEQYYIKPYFWCPEEKVKERYIKGETFYQDWVDQGYLDITPGNVIDYSYIRKKIADLNELYYIKQISFDRWNASEIVQNLENDGFMMLAFSQSMTNISAPTKELLRMILAKEIVHDSNPVLNWMCDNLAVKQDANGNIKPDKQKSTEKIDGMVALIMALDAAIRETGMIYEDRGIIAL